MKQLFFILALLSSLQVWAQDYTENNVNYYISGSEAYVGESPLATGDITILGSINVNGNEYPVTSIANLAFYYYCDNLESVVISNNITSIGSYAFSCCENLSSIVIPETVTSIGEGAFNQCSSLTSIDLPNGITNISKETFRGAGLTSITINEGVVTIGENAFAGCDNLSAIHLPSSLKYIEYNAFYCKKISEIHIPSLEWWCNLVFSDETHNPFYYAHRFYHLYVNGKEVKDLSIPNSITAIKKYSFSGGSFVSVNIPNSVTSIEASAFYSCSISSINISQGVKTIGNGAFSYCSNLTSVVLPEGLTSIGHQSFSNISSLSSVTIPTSVTTIGRYAFLGCNLASVTVNNPTPLNIPLSNIDVNYDPFPSRANATLYVPAGCKDAYEAADYWKEFKEIVEMSTATSETIDISSAGIRTFTSSHALDFTGISGLQAYIISGFRPSTGALVLTQVNDVPAGEGLLLRGAAGEYEIPCTTTDMYYTNLLTGVTSTTEISPTDGDQTNFILADGIHGINFYTLSETGEIEAGKAYLHLPTSVLTSSAREGKFVFDFDGDNITGIDEHEADIITEERYFDLQGRVVKKPSNGIYILNGKKIFIK